MLSQFVKLPYKTHGLKLAFSGLFTLLLTGCGMFGFKPAAQVYGGLVGSDIVDLQLSATSSLIAPEDCVPITVQTVDAQKNALMVRTAQSFEVSGLRSNDALFSNSQCSSPASNVDFQIPAGQSSKTFFFQAHDFGSLTLSILFAKIIKKDLSLSIPSVAKRLSIQDGSTSLVLGQCSSVAFSVRVLNSQGNPVNVATGQTLTIALTAQSGVANFYSNPGCSQPANSVTLTAGQQSFNFYVQALSRNTMTVNASTVGVQSASQLINVSAIPLSVSLTGPSSVVAGAVSSAFTVTLLDGLNTPIASSGGDTIALGGSVSSIGSFCSTTSCVSPITQVSIPSGSTSASFYFVSSNNLESRTETLIVTPSNTGIAADQANLLIQRRQPMKIQLSGGPSNGKVDLAVCSASVFSVGLLDASGQPVTVPTGQPITVNLNLSSGSGTFYSNAGCSQAITSLSFTQGQQSQNFYFKAGSYGTLTLRGADAAGSLTAGTMNVSVQSLPVALLLSGPTSVTAGVVTGPYTVTVVDALNNPIGSSSAISVSLANNPSDLRSAFCSSSSCPPNSYISQITINASVSSANFYYFSDVDASTTAQIQASTGSSLTASSLTVSITRISLNNDPLLTSWGNSSTSFTGSLSNGDAMGMALSSNRMIMGGYQANNGGQKQIAIAQYLWDANNPSVVSNLDSSFGSSGRLSFKIGNASWVSAVASTSSGFVFAGVTQNPQTTDSGGNISGGDYDVILFRLTSTGAYDGNFGTSGIVQWSAPGDQYATSIAVTSDGFIYVGGYAAPDSPTVVNSADFLLMAFDSSGNAAGNFRADLNGLTDTANALLIQTIAGQEKIFLGGIQSDGTSNDFAIALFNGRNNSNGALGALDSSFATQGKLIIDMGSVGDQLRTLSRQSNGNILAAGYRQLTSTTTDIAITSFSTAGNFDTSFGSLGKNIIQLAGVNREKIYASATDSRTGDNFLAGESENGFLILRLNNVGANLTDPRTYGSSGDSAKALRLDPIYAKPIVAGRTSSGNFKGMRFLR